MHSQMSASQIKRKAGQSNEVVISLMNTLAGIQMEACQMVMATIPIISLEVFPACSHTEKEDTKLIDLFR